MQYVSLLFWAALFAQNVEGPRFDVASVKRIGPTLPFVSPLPPLRPDSWQRPVPRFLKPGPDGFPVFPPGFDIGPAGFGGRWAVQRVGITIGDFAKQLEGSQLDGVVVDRTGLTGKFDILLKWGSTLGAPSPDATNSPEFSEPPLLKALRDQLGLIVREGKGPAEVIVIDSIDAVATPN